MVDFNHLRPIKINAQTTQKQIAYLVPPKYPEIQQKIALLFTSTSAENNPIQQSTKNNTNPRKLINQLWIKNIPLAEHQYHDKIPAKTQPSITLETHSTIPTKNPKSGNQ